MLVLTRRKREAIRIGNVVTVKVLAVHVNRVQLGIDAPAEVRVCRSELAPENVPAQRPDKQQDRLPSWKWIARQRQQRGRNRSCQTTGFWSAAGLREKKNSFTSRINRHPSPTRVPWRPAACWADCLSDDPPGTSCRFTQPTVACSSRSSIQAASSPRPDSDPTLKRQHSETATLHQSHHAIDRQPAAFNPFGRGQPLRRHL